jgi:hypothetical protein
MKNKILAFVLAFMLFPACKTASPNIEMPPEIVYPGTFDAAILTANPLPCTLFEGCVSYQEEVLNKNGDQTGVFATKYSCEKPQQFFMYEGLVSVKDENGNFSFLNLPIISHTQINFSHEKTTEIMGEVLPVVSVITTYSISSERSGSNRTATALYVRGGASTKDKK